MRRPSHGALCALVIAACSAPAAPRQAPPPPPPPQVAPPQAPPPVVVCCKDGEAPPTRDQPPEVKLKLGHYRNRERGIGVIIDRTGDPAKVKFDGSAEIIKLDKHANRERTDYFRTLNNTVLQVWNDGRVVVYVAGAPDGIEVRRDGDADPL